VNDDPLQDGELRDVARRLGARAAERLDVERTAAAVLRRLAEKPRREPWTHEPAVWLRLAAAVALLLGAGTLLHTRRRPAAQSVVAGVEVNDLSAEQLRDVLKTVDQSVDDETTGAAGALGATETELDDLTAPELRTLLRTLEG
jgi:hypothetical protein